MKVVLALVGLAVVGVTFAAAAAVRKAPTRIFPYVVPDSYFEAGASRAVARSLGHGLSVTLVFELDGAVRGVSPSDLTRLGLTVEQAHARAISNLEELAAARRIQLSAFDGPARRRFVLVGGSWAAATAILLPGLRDLVAGQVGSREICASIPHREAMLLFAKGDRANRDQMRALVREKESDGRKPLTFELFELAEAGPRPFFER